MLQAFDCIPRDLLSQKLHTYGISLNAAKKEEAIINSFISANFNYCPLVWYFCSCKSSNKIQKPCLGIILNTKKRLRTSFKNSSRTTMNIKRMRNLAIEIFKTFNNFNLSFMKEIFTTKTDARIQPNGIAVKSRNTATYGDKSLTTLGPKICNSFTERYLKDI